MDGDVPMWKDNTIDPLITKNNELIDERRNLMNEFNELNNTSIFDFKAYDLRVQQIKERIQESFIESMNIAMNFEHVNSEIALATIYEAYRYERYMGNYNKKFSDSRAMIDCDILTKTLTTMFENMKPNKFSDRLNYLR